MATQSVLIKDVVFEAETLYSEYIPARISGPPENCSPEEGGELIAIEFEAAYIMEGEVELPREYGEYLFNKFYEDILDDFRNGFVL